MYNLLGKSIKAKRLVIKAGTNVLTGNSDNLDIGVMAMIVKQIADLRVRGLDIILVTSGAIAVGGQLIGHRSVNHSISYRQVLAAVGQSRLMHVYEELFSKHDITVAQALLSRNNITDREGYLNVRNTLLSLLDLGVVPIINENDVVAVEEIGVEVFGDNDRLSAMVANLVDADLLIMLSDIDGLHTSDPHENPDAKLVQYVGKVDDSIEAMAGANHSDRSRGGMHGKLEAIKLATASGVSVCLVNGREDSIIQRLFDGESIGTLFDASSTKMESRKRWMVSRISSSGRIVVDHGAVDALNNRSSSLLPAGITGVEGHFDRGDIILVLGPNNTDVACGISNYGSQDVDLIKGIKSDRIMDILGYEYGDEILHRDNMVLL